MSYIIHYKVKMLSTQDELKSGWHESRYRESQIEFKSIQAADEFLEELNRNADVFDVRIEEKYV
jgi:hypothetical protein